MQTARRAGVIATIAAVVADDGGLSVTQAYSLLLNMAGPS
jgi:hypothetical protein